MTIPINASDLPAYPANTGATPQRLRDVARDLDIRADSLGHALDDATESFESVFAEADKRTATERRIKTAAKAARGR